MAHLSRLLCVLAVSTLAAGCTTLTQGDPCEDANLGETGKVAGLAGKPLASNPRAEKCLTSSDTSKVQKLHEGYESGLDLFCGEERAEKRGANALELGDLAQCGPERSELARAAYERGTRIYCQPSNGFVQGTMGTTPNPACTQTEWLSEYRAGRQFYLQAQLDSLPGQKANLGAQIASLEAQKGALHGELMSIMGTDVESEGRRGAIQGQLMGIDGQISALHAQEMAVDSEMQKLNSEVTTF